MEKHVRLLAILSIVYGALHFVAALVGWVFLHSSSLLHSVIPPEKAGAFLFASSIVVILLFIVMFLSAANVVGGVGLMNRQRWGRILVLVLSFLNLVHFPLGTALGVYGIWVLMKDETDALFSRGDAPSMQPQGGPGR
jgi:hypothetical protein